MSVVLPVYNGDVALIDRAVDSVRQQRCPHWELVIVDDGSEPRVADHLDSYAAEDQRITVLHQPNAGVSGARNAGVESAIGDYVAFLDADDWLLPDFLFQAKALLKKLRADVVFGAMEVRTDRTAFWRSGGPSSADARIADSASRREAAMRAFSDSPSPTEASSVLSVTNAVAAVYARRLARDQKFPVGVSHAEDRLFTAGVLTLSDRIVFCSEPWYVYDQTSEQGVTRNVNSDTPEQFARTVRAMADRAALSAADEQLARAAAGGMVNYLKLVAAVEGAFPHIVAGRGALRPLLGDVRVRTAVRAFRPTRVRDALVVTLIRIRSVAGLRILGRLWVRSGALAMRPPL